MNAGLVARFDNDRQVSGYVDDSADNSVFRFPGRVGVEVEDIIVFDAPPGRLA